MLGSMRLLTEQGNTTGTCQHSTQHTELLTWESYHLCPCVMQNIEKGFRAGPEKQFAPLPASGPHYCATEIGSEFWCISGGEDNWPNSSTLTQTDIMNEGRGGGSLFSSYIRGKVAAITKFCTEPGWIVKVKSGGNSCVRCTPCLRSEDANCRISFLNSTYALGCSLLSDLGLIWLCIPLPEKLKGKGMPGARLMVGVKREQR